MAGKAQPAGRLPVAGGRGAVGQNVARIDGLAKAAGTARYIDDLTFPGMLHGRTVRSPIASGRLDGVRCAFGPNDGFALVNYRDVPGTNVVTLIHDDQPCLVEREIRHVAEPVLLLAHEDRERLFGVDVRVDYETDSPVFYQEHSAREQASLRCERVDAAAS